MIRQRLAVFLALLIPTQGMAASFTTALSGILPDGATWGNTSPGAAGVDYPTNGDFINITSGKRVIVPANYAINIGSGTAFGGTSGAHTGLIIQGGTFGLLGNFVMGYSGSTNVDFFATSGTVLNLYGNNVVMSAGGNSFNNINIGAQGSSTTLNGGNFGSFTQGAQGGFNNMNASFTLVNITSMGAVGLSYGTAGTGFAMSSCTITHSKRLQLPQDQTSPSQYRYVENTTITDPQDQIVIRVRSTNPSRMPLGRNDLSHVSISSESVAGTIPVIEVDASSVNFNNVYLKNVSVQHSTSQGYGGDFEYVAFLETAAISGVTSAQLQGGTTLQYFLLYNEGDNPHPLQWAPVINTTRTVNIGVVEVNTQGTITDNGDTNLEPTTNQTYGSITGVIQTCTRNCSVLLSLQGGAAWTSSTTMNNNTVYMGPVSTQSLVTHDCFRFGETYGGRASMWQSIQSSFCVFPSSDTAAFIIRDQNVAAATDKCVTCDYNGNYNVAGTKYAITKSAGVYGQHDIQADPTFCDKTRNIQTFDAAQGGPGTAESFIRNLLNQNATDGSYNSAYNLAAFIKYKQDGFTPQAVIFKGAGDHGQDVGAMPVRLPYGFFGAGL